MGYADSVLASPYAWLLAVAMLFALALRTALALLLRRDAPQRTRDRRLTLLFVWTAAGLALATATLIVHGHEVLLAGAALLFLGVVLGLLTLAFYFLRAVGIPLLFLASAFGLFSIYLAQPWEPVGERVGLAEITVLSAAGSSMSLEIRPYGAEPTGEEVIRLPGESIAVTVELVSYHPYWFFLGRRLGARMVSLSSYAGGADDDDADGGGARGGGARAPVEDVEMPDPCSDAVCRFVRGHLESIPGIAVERVSVSPVRVEPLSRYRVVVTPPGSLSLTID